MIYLHKPSSVPFGPIGIIPAIPLGPSVEGLAPSVCSGTPPAITQHVTLNVLEGHMQTIITEDYTHEVIVFTVENSDEMIVYEVNDATLIKGTNFIQFQVVPEILSLHTRYIYAIRRVSDNKVLQKGKLYVEYAAAPLAARTANL